MQINSITLSRLKRRILKHVWLVRGVIVGMIVAGLVGLFLILKLIFVNSPLVWLLSNKITVIEGRTNILILGKAGAGYTAPDLTDTIILASVGIDKPGVALISLPRDIWVSAIRAKLNSAYYWGKQKQPEGGGLVLAKATVEEITGEAIPYGVVVDFSIFEKVINALDGIEVEVARSFTDAKYPIAGRENDECGGDPEYGCRYETVKFDEGLQKMDGELALKFVRSRNAEGEEGTDLAREARQQKVIGAIRKKILTPVVLLSPRRVVTLWRIVENSVETDLPPEAMATLVKRVFWGRNKIVSEVLPETFLENPPLTERHDNQYVFIPKSGDWSQVQGWIDGKLH